MDRTYQDLQAIGDNETLRMEFVRGLISSHEGDPMYRIAKIADQYDRHKNVTITQFQKILYTVTGKAVPDNYSANYKLASRFFNRFVVQETQYLLGNGVTWADKNTRDKVGKDFDNKLQKLGKAALVGGVAFGFFNFDHLEVFELKEFVPLYDEENGSLSAGVRFWQIDPRKPLRATLYEIDGYTDYMWKDGKGEILHDKRPYILKTVSTPADGEVIYDGENYPGFPIVPLWGNPHHQSEIIGLQEQIDCYDLIKSGFANTVDEASLIYWTIRNAGGMDDVDMAEFVQRIRTLHIATATDEADAQPQQLEAPYNSREALLDRLRSDLYEDAMALDTKNIANGAVTATQIQAAYEPLNEKVDQFEYCVLDFLYGILEIAGIDEDPSFTRSMIVNASEEIQNVIQAGDYLSREYKVKKILTLLGDGDKYDEVMQQLDLEMDANVIVDEDENNEGENAGQEEEEPEQVTPQEGEEQ